MRFHSFAGYLLAIYPKTERWRRGADLGEQDSFTGLSIAYLFKIIWVKDDAETRERQKEIRKWLNDVDGASPAGKKWRKIMKFAVPIWFFFAMGPGCILGNQAFSFSGFPPLWSWQIVMWIPGVVMMWALCFKAEMSATNKTQIARAEKEQYIEKR